MAILKLKAGTLSKAQHPATDFLCMVFLAELHLNNPALCTSSNPRSDLIMYAFRCGIKHTDRPQFD